MPKELEDKLKKEYGAKSDIPYKIMNKMGVLHEKKEKIAKHMSLKGAKERFKRELK